MYTKSPQINHYLCSKYVMYRPDLCNLQTIKTAKKEAKNWNWHDVILYYWKPPISTLPINLRWHKTKHIIFRPDLWFQKRISIGTHKERVELSINSDVKGFKYKLVIKLLDSSTIRESTQEMYWPTQSK